MSETPPVDPQPSEDLLPQIAGAVDTIATNTGQTSDKLDALTSATTRASTNTNNVLDTVGRAVTAVGGAVTKGFDTTAQKLDDLHSATERTTASVDRLAGALLAPRTPGPQQQAPDLLRRFIGDDSYKPLAQTKVTHHLEDGGFRFDGNKVTYAPDAAGYVKPELTDGSSPVGYDTERQLPSGEQLLDYGQFDRINRGIQRLRGEDSRRGWFGRYIVGSALVLRGLVDVPESAMREVATRAREAREIVRQDMRRSRLSRGVSSMILTGIIRGGEAYGNSTNPFANRSRRVRVLDRGPTGARTRNGVTTY